VLGECEIEGAEIQVKRKCNNLNEHIRSVHRAYQYLLSVISEASFFIDALFCERAPSVRTA
jgi:hypothetical protein